MVLRPSYARDHEATTMISLSRMVPNVGSAARDFCMLERNLLSHLKLALILSLLSSSMLLRTRLVPDPADPPEKLEHSGTPLAWVQVAASLLVVAAGTWEYRHGCQDFIDMRPFLGATEYAFLSELF